MDMSWRFPCARRGARQAKTSQVRRGRDSVGIAYKVLAWLISDFAKNGGNLLFLQIGMQSA
jgi:hypothetical protein